MLGRKKFTKSLIKVVAKEAKRHISNSEFKEVFSNHFTGSAGPKQMKRKLSHDEVFIGKIFYGFLEIEHCFERLGQIDIFLKNYDSCITLKKKGITRSAYLTYHIEKYLEEMYILKERLSVFLKILERLYKNNGSETKKQLITLAGRIEKSLAGIVTTRGAHIHRNRFTDEDIARLETYDFLLKAGGMPSEFEKLSKKEFNSIAKKWSATLQNNKKELKS